MFLSRPAVLSGSQERESQRWTGAIEAAGFVSSGYSAQATNQTLGPNYVTSLSRWMEPSSLVSANCRSTVCGARTRPKRWPRSPPGPPWLQIEAGMALMQGLPVLVAPERDVTEGVFEHRRWTGLLFGTEMEGEPVGEPGNAWIDAVRRRSRTSAVGKLPDLQAS